MRDRADIIVNIGVKPNLVTMKPQIMVPMAIERVGEGERKGWLKRGI